MRGTLEDMKSAYDSFNETLFCGMLLPLNGDRRVELCVEGMSNDAECSYQDHGFKIAFNDKDFGTDIDRDLVLLFHGQMHTHVGWDSVSTMHKGAWLEGMKYNGIEVASNGALIRVVPDGLFDQRRSEWLRRRKRSFPVEDFQAPRFAMAAPDARAEVRDGISGPSALLIFALATAASVVVGICINTSTGGMGTNGRHNNFLYDGGE